MALGDGGTATAQWNTSPIGSVERGLDDSVAGRWRWEMGAPQLPSGIRPISDGKEKTLFMAGRFPRCQMEYSPLGNGR